MTRDVDRLPVDAFQTTQIPSGSIRRLELVIDHLPDGQRLSFPTLIARGAHPGKTLLAIGAVHGDEYEGTIAIQNVFADLDPAAMRGTFVGIPVMNGPAFAAAQREGHWDHLNLARVSRQRLRQPDHAYRACLPRAPAAAGRPAAQHPQRR